MGLLGAAHVWGGTGGGGATKRAPFCYYIYPYITVVSYPKKIQKHVNI